MTGEEELQRTSILPWQKQLWENWSQSLTRNHIAHAILLHGWHGGGKYLLAREMANALLCENKDAMQLACNHCRGCRLRLAGTHPDLWQSIADDNGVAGRLGVDEVRSLIDWVIMSPQYAGYKVIIIEHLDRLTKSAANALLKTLEEPPARVVFILSTSYISLIPPTIRSRCSKVRVTVPQMEQGIEFLKSERNLPTDYAISLWKQNYGDVFSIISSNNVKSNAKDSGDIDELNLTVVECILAICDGKTDFNEGVTQLKQYGIRRLGNTLFQTVHEGIRIKMNMTPSDLTNSIDANDKYSKLAQYFANRFNNEQLFLMLEKILDVRYLLFKQTTVNEPLLVESVVIYFKNAFAKTG